MRRRKGALPELKTPSEAEVADFLRERYPSGLTVAMVSYHTNPLYAIKERVRAEEGIDIDPFDHRYRPFRPGRPGNLSGEGGLRAG